MHPTPLSARRPVWWVAPWVALLAASIALAYTFNSAFVGSSATAGTPQTIVVTPASTRDPGPSCTWIGAYCAFADR
jgi:hypothetical protein